MKKSVMWMLVAGAVASFPVRDVCAGGVIEAGKARHVRKDHEAWKERGRIVGLAKQAPQFTLELRDSDGSVAKLAQCAAGAYELEWLEPGHYTMRVTAEGFVPREIEGIEVKAGHDVRIDLEFSR